MIVGLLEGKEIGASSFMGETVQVIRGGQLILGADSTIGDADSAGLIVDASVSGNTLTLTRYDGETINFSKATTLSAGWSGGIYTVEASPQGNSRETGLKSVANADISWSGNVASFLVYAYNDGSETPISTGKTLSVDATARYNAGYDAGKADLTITDYRVFTHNAQSTPSGYTRASNGYYIRGSGSSAEVRIYTGCDVTVNGAILFSTATPTDDYLETMPTNVYRDGYSAGKSAISSSDITDYDLFTTNAPSTPSGYTRDNHGYYIKDAGTESAEVRIYTYAEMTVNGKLLRSSSASQYDYLGVMPTYVYQDGFKEGYDADHSMFIGDANEDDVGTSVNVEVGDPVEVWAYFKKKGSGYQWSSKYTFTAVDPYPHSIAVTKAMTGVDQSELPVYYGKLYALIQGSYQAITSNNYYWYYSSTNISSRTLHY